MKIWLTEIGEPLPIDAGSRLMRCGLLTQTLASRDHDVTWWASTFDHARKMYRRPSSETASPSPHLDLELLHASGYRRNVSLARIRYHRRIARQFSVRAEALPPPDLVYCCVPTLEVTEAALRYATTRGIPVIVDVRDRWPDIFVEPLPRPLRAIARLLLRSEFRRARYVFRSATAILAVSDGYLEWGLRQAARPRGFSDAVFPHAYPRRMLDAAVVARARDELEAVGVDGRRVICAFVGSFGRTYDLGTVIDAARLLQRAGRDDVQFVLAGDGEQRAAWQAQAAGLSNVVLTDWISGDAIAVLLGMARLGLAAYARHAPQGLPNKLFEYLSAGLPVVSSLRGETERFLSESACGVTYPAGDAPALAALLQRLAADDTARREMGRRALARYDAEFSAQQVYGRLADHLERLTPATR